MEDLTNFSQNQHTQTKEREWRTIKILTIIIKESEKLTLNVQDHLLILWVSVHLHQRLVQISGVQRLIKENINGGEGNQAWGAMVCEEHEDAVVGAGVDNLWLGKKEKWKR